MLIFFGTLFKTNKDFFIFQLKDYDRVLKYIKNNTEPGTLKRLCEEDIVDGKFYLYKSENADILKRVVIRKNADSCSFTCECLDDFLTITTSLDMIYEIPQPLAVIEPQILKCKLVENISDDYINALNFYDESNRSDTCNGVVKIQVDQVDHSRFYHLKSITIIYTSSLNKSNKRESDLGISHKINEPHINNEPIINSSDFKNFGFDFNYPETSITQSNVVSVSGRKVATKKSDVHIEKSLTKEQIKKSKLQLTTKYTHEAKHRPYGVLVIDSIVNKSLKKLSVPQSVHIERASDHYTRSIAKLKLSMNSHFCQLLSFEHIVSGRDVTLVGTVKSGLSTALALGLSFKMFNLLEIGQLPINKLHVIILVKNAASGRYLEKFLKTIFKRTAQKQSSLKILFIDEITNNTESSADIITANIIIGSLRCILEALSQQFIVLNDLKCVFIDDAHVILRNCATECQSFFNQLKQIEDKSNLWSMLSSDSKNMKTSISSESVGQQSIQIISNSHKWNLELKSFQEAFVAKPLTFIIDPLEMISYLSPCLYIPKFGFHSNSDSLKSHFMNWVNANISQGNLLVFTRTALECEMVYELCNGNGIKTLRGTGFVDPGKIYDLNTVWCATRNSFLRYVFIVSDCALINLTISDAFYTYHYTLPCTKADLRNRLGCSLSFYQNIVNKTFTPKESFAGINQYVAVCPSFDCSNFAYCYKHLAVNCDKSQISTSVNNFYKSKLYTKEYVKCDKLCPNMKLYGMCLVDKVFCKHSHLPWIINLMEHVIHRGSVTFTVSSVRSCTQIFGIVENFFTGNAVLDQNINKIISQNRMQLLNDLSFDMQLDSTKEQIKFTSKLLENNCLYVCKDQTGAYYRCKLLSECVENKNLVCVNCIDTGVNRFVNKNDIFELPDEFKSIKPLVYEFIFTKYVPADIIYGWPNYHNIQVTEALLGKTVNAHILYGLDNVIWIDSLIQKSKLDNMKKSVVNFLLGHFLKGVPCSRSSDQLENYVNHLSCATYQYQLKSSGHYKNLIGSTVDVCQNDSFQQASVSEFSSSHFHINHCDDDQIKEKVFNEINDIVAEFETKNQIQHFRINDLCLAKFPDNKWYRARVTQFNESPPQQCSYNVYMIDIGEACNDLELDHLIPIVNTHSLTTIPGMAIRCSIVGADFTNLNEDQLDAVFEYMDNLSDNFYVKYECNGTHSKSDPIIEITHQIQCYYSMNKCVDEHSPNEENTEFCNVLLDLYLDFHVKPSDTINQILYDHFEIENKNIMNKYSSDKWVAFVCKVKSDEALLEKLKSLLNQHQNHSIVSNDVEQPSEITDEVEMTEKPLTIENPVFINKAPKSIKWYETSEGCIKIRVVTNDPFDVSIEIESNYITLKYNDSFKGCDIRMKFFGSVKPETQTTKITSCCLYINVEKQEMVNWKNLFDSNTKLQWIVYDFDNVEVDEKPFQELKDTKQINWSAISTESNKRAIKNSSIEFRLPEDDDHFEATSSELSELEGFHSDVEDHEEIF